LEETTMTHKHFATGLILAFWTWNALTNGQEQWIDDIPASAIPGDRHVNGGNVIIAASADGKQLFGFSPKLPKWVSPSETPPGDPEIVLIVGTNVAAAWSGRYCFAYSGLLGRWDVLLSPDDEPARPSVSSSAVTVNLKDANYLFRADWGKWFSAEEIKAGRVADYLAKERPTSDDEQIKMIELSKADAAKIAELLQLLLADKQLSIGADTRTNTLIVRGPEASLEIVEAICLKLDNQGPVKSPPNADTDAAPASTVALARLRKRYAAEDKAAHELATKIRGAEARLSSGENGVPPLGYSRQQSAIVGMRRELRDKVAAAFRTRQDLIAAQVADLERRTAELRESLALRDAAAEQVIDRRVEDLLNPSLKWDMSRSRQRVYKRRRTKSPPRLLWPSYHVGKRRLSNCMDRRPNYFAVP
jgi:hypothetical protein